MSVTRCIDVPGVFWRKTPRDLVGRNLLGKVIVIVRKCVTCGFEGPASAFPLESKSKRRDDNHVRCQCAPCHNKYRGKVKPGPSVPTNTLDGFIECAEPTKDIPKVKRIRNKEQSNTVMTFINYEEPDA